MNTPECIICELLLTPVSVMLCTALSGNALQKTGNKNIKKVQTPPKRGFLSLLTAHHLLHLGYAMCDHVPHQLRWGCLKVRR